MNRVSSFFKKLFRDARGEDLTEKSSGLSNAAKAVLAATVITAAAGGAAVLANNANSAGDTVSGKINGAVGAGANTAANVPTPFGGK